MRAATPPSTSTSRRTTAASSGAPLDIPPGFPGADLDDAQHLARFQDCLGYAPRCLPVAQVDRLLAALQDIARLDDVRSLVPMLVASDP